MSLDLMLGKFFKITIAIVVSMAIGAWVVVCMWDWFVIPKFNLDPLSIVEAAGLTMLCRFVFTNAKYEDRDNDKLNEKIIFSIVYPLLILLFAWVISLMM